jgi:hypothetical protein
MLGAASDTNKKKEGKRCCAELLLRGMFTQFERGEREDKEGKWKYNGGGELVQDTPYTFITVKFLCTLNV